jgi:SAM-dependent methyltransferase
MGFRSLTYRSGHIYNFVNQRLYDWEKKFATLGKIVNGSRSSGVKLKILDLPCGTGYLARYLDPTVEYEGWDLNPAFLKKVKLDWKKGRLKPNKIILKRRNIFRFDAYPKDKIDVIVFSGILHHIYPRHIELVEHAKKHAHKIVMCEPFAIKPMDINAYDWTAKFAMFFTKFLPEPIYKYIDIFLADNDGINSFKRRSSWTYDENGLKELYKLLGVKKIYTLDDECIGIWEKK